MKYIIKNILNNKFVTILLILQMVLGLSAIYNSIDISNRLNSEIEKFDKGFNGGRVYKIRNEYFNQSENIIKADLEKLNEALINIDNNENIEYPYSFDIPIYKDNFEVRTGFESSPDIIDRDGETYFRSYSIFMNDLAKDKADLKVIEGNWFSDKKLSETPVILGYDYKEHYKVGDKFKFIDFENDKVIGSAKVIGFLEKGSEISANLELPLDLRDVNLDKYIIFNDRNLINNRYSILELLFGNYIYFDKDMSLEQIQKEQDKIVKDFNDANLPVYLSYEGKELEKNIEALENSKELSMLTSIIISIFLSITIVLTLINSVIKRTKEFGVHILNGASLKKIISFIWGEIFILIGISFGIFLLKEILLNKDINYMLIVQIIIGSFIYSLVVSIIPIIKLKSISIRDMVNGRE